MESFAKFGEGRFEYLKFLADDLEDFEKLYEISRDKVCEIFAIRALVRTHPEDVTRRSLCDKAEKMVEDLGGKLPAPLAMLVKSTDKPVAKA